MYHDKVSTNVFVGVGSCLLFVKTKIQHLWSAIKRRAINWGMPVLVLGLIQAKHRQLMGLLGALATEGPQMESALGWDSGKWSISFWLPPTPHDVLAGWWMQTVCSDCSPAAGEAQFTQLVKGWTLKTCFLLVKRKKRKTCLEMAGLFACSWGGRTLPTSVPPPSSCQHCNKLAGLSLLSPTHGQAAR